MPRKTYKYAEKDMQDAIKAIKKGAPISTMAKKYNIPRGTIQNRLKSRARKETCGPSPILSKDEEQLIINWLIDNQKKGFPRRKTDIQQAVKSFLEQVPRPNPFKGNVPGEKWFQSFLKRHPEISVRTPEAITSASATVSEYDIRQWFARIEDYLKETNCLDILNDPRRVFNGDETNFILCPKGGRVLAEKGSKNVYETDRGKAKENVTVMFSFSAAGDVVPPMIVYPYKRMKTDILDNIPEGIAWEKSDSGWMTSEVFEKYMENVLYEYIRNHKIQLPVILFVDGHRTHLTYSLSLLCSRLKIITICLFPNATRILQPADVSVFKPLKCGWIKEVHTWRRNHLDQNLTKKDFAPLLQRTIEKHIKKETIINGFKACGLHPFDPSAIDYSKCLGKNTRQPPARPYQSEASVSYTRFKEIIGARMLRQLEEFCPEVMPCSSYFVALHNIYTELKPTIEQDKSCENILEETEDFEFLYDAPDANDTPVDCDEEHETGNIIEHAPAGASSKNVTDASTVEELPIVPANETSDITNFLPLPTTPQRQGSRNTTRQSFIITSSPFRRVEEEKLARKERIESARQEKILQRKCKKKVAERCKQEKAALRKEKRQTLQRKKEEAERLKQEKAILREDKTQALQRKKEEAQRRKQEKAALREEKKKALQRKRQETMKRKHARASFETSTGQEISNKENEDPNREDDSISNKEESINEIFEMLCKDL